MQAADQADDAVGGQHAGGGVVVAGGGGADDVVHRFDQIIDAERNGGDEDGLEEAPVQPAEDQSDGAGVGTEKPKVWNESFSVSRLMPPIVKAEQVRAPGDERAGGDGDQARGNAAVLHAAKPAHQDDREADDADRPAS